MDEFTAAMNKMLDQEVLRHDALEARLKAVGERLRSLGDDLAGIAAEIQRNEEELADIEAQLGAD